MGKGIVLLKEKAERCKSYVNEETNDSEETFVSGVHSWIRYWLWGAMQGGRNNCAYHSKRYFGRQAQFQHQPNGIQIMHDPEVLSVVSDLMKSLDWNGVAQIDLRYDTSKRQNFGHRGQWALLVNLTGVIACWCQFSESGNSVRFGQ